MLTELSRAVTLVPESDAVMLASGEFGGEPVTVTPSALYLRELTGGPSRVAIYDLLGKPTGVLPLPDIASVNEVEPLERRHALVFHRDLSASAVFSPLRCAGRPKPRDTRLAQTSPVTFADTEVVREFAKSKDGTRFRSTSCAARALQLDGYEPGAALRLRRLRHQR